MSNMTTFRRAVITISVVLAIIVLVLAALILSFQRGGEETCFDPDGFGPIPEQCSSD